jgi:tight adherence protein B
MSLPRVVAALAVGLAAFAGTTGAGAQEPGDLWTAAVAARALSTVSASVAPAPPLVGVEPSITVEAAGRSLFAAIHLPAAEALYQQTTTTVTVAPPAPASGPGLFSASWMLPAGAAAFFLAAVLIFGLTLVPADRPRSQLAGAARKRFTASGGVLTRLAARAGWLAESAISRIARRGKLGRSLDAAGVRLSAGEFMVLTVCTGLVGAVLGAFIYRLPGALIVGALGAFLPRLAVLQRLQKRRITFADQLDGTLQLMAGSLRAGYGLMQSVNTVATEAASPTAEEFGRIIVETRLGRDLVDSLSALSDRMDSEDAQWVAQAIDIQRSVGGDLAQVLDTVSQTIRERNQIRRQVKALSAEGRFSAYILIALPFLIAGFMMLAVPSYLAPLVETSAGKMALGAGALLMVIGMIWIRRLVRLWF